MEIKIAEPMDERTARYVEAFQRMIQTETISSGEDDPEKFVRFQALLKELFPHVFAVCEIENFDGSLLLKWKGQGAEGDPVLFMNHQDVVEATGEWEHEPFSGEIADGRIWGRGTLDDKGGLWGMLQAAEELMTEGFTPKRDIYFESSRNEEINGTGSNRISKELKQRGMRFDYVLDEGGMIVEEPIGGAKGYFAMIGVGEKCTTNLKFIAKSSGGHASTPGKNTPLVRLAKFMAAAENSSIFKVELSPVIAEMLRRVGPHMTSPLKEVMSHPELFKPAIEKAMPAISPTAGALLKTTLAFTMAKGSDGRNVLPQEAWVVGNMRCSHHQGLKESVHAIKKLAAKYDLTMEVLDKGFPSPLSDFNGAAFKRVEEAVEAIFPGVPTVPYIMTGASDSRFMSRVCDQCIRFSPFSIQAKQLGSVHGLNENVEVKCLAPAVDFYRYLMERV